MGELVRPCPLCSTRSGTVRYTQRAELPDEMGAGSDLDIVTCDRCGFAFADLPATQPELDRAYAEHSKYADESLIDDDHHSDPPWDADRMRGVARWLAGAIPDRNTPVLDAGCAGGSFLGFMKGHGFNNVKGIDPSPRATAIARRMHGVDAVTGSFMSPPRDLGKFGLITLQHTLEHLREVRSAVTALRDSLDEGGLVFLEVPDARHYADMLVAPFHDFNTEHINHFSLRILDGLMHREGFESLAGGEKAIMASPRHRYAAAFGLWRKLDGPAPGGEMRFDEEYVAAIVRYVEQSNVLMQRIDESLRASLRGRDDVVVWGTGQLAFKLLRGTVLSEKSVTFVDGSPQKQGMHLAGRSIVAPSELERAGRPIVVGSILASDAIVGAITARFGSARDVIMLPEGTGVTP